MNDDEWQTPQALYDKLCDRYEFNPKLDVAATLENTKCSAYLDDAFVQEWTLPFVEHLDVWCNPPHSKPNLSKYVERAEEQHKKNGIRIMMIVPANFGSTVTFHKYIQRKRFYEFIEGRIKFEKKNENYGNTRNAYIVILWGKYSTRFIDDLILAHKGEISK